MYNNQVQQVQQKINSVHQMVAQIKQNEQNSQHRLQQIAQEEAYAVQQLQRVQQLCQECVSGLQSISLGTTQQSFATTSVPYGTSTFQPTTQSSFGGNQGSTLFNPNISNPASAGIRSTQMMGGQISDIATMDPDTYQASQQILGGGNTSLSQIGQQAGVSGVAGISNAQQGMSGMAQNMGYSQ